MQIYMWYSRSECYIAIFASYAKIYAVHKGWVLHCHSGQLCKYICGTQGVSVPLPYLPAMQRYTRCSRGECYMAIVVSYAKIYAVLKGWGLYGHSGQLCKDICSAQRVGVTWPWWCSRGGCYIVTEASYLKISWVLQGWVLHCDSGSLCKDICGTQGLSVTFP